MTAIGFTGTRHGMTRVQLRAVEQLVADLTRGEPPCWAHHGDCVGADAEFHGVVAAIDGARIVVHPGPAYDIARQAGCAGHERREPLPHMRRNANIVRESTVMIAAPYQETERRSGGTWATIRMARMAGKPLAIVYPSGVVATEWWRDLAGSVHGTAVTARGDR